MPEEALLLKGIIFEVTPESFKNLESVKLFKKQLKRGSLKSCLSDFVGFRFKYFFSVNNFVFK